MACAGWHASLQVAKAGMHEYEIGEAAREAATRTAASFMSEIEDKHHSPLTDGVQLVQARRTILDLPRARFHQSPEGRRHGRHVLLSDEPVQRLQGRICAKFLRWPRDLGNAEVYKILHDAQMAAFAELKPGVKGSDLDRLVRKRIDAAGYGQYIEHRLGRGVGVLYAEAPDLKEGDDTIIEADFCLSIEPAVYMTGKWGDRDRGQRPRDAKRLGIPDRTGTAGAADRLRLPCIDAAAAPTGARCLTAYASRSSIGAFPLLSEGVES